MKFKLDKHNLDELYWLIQDIYNDLENNEYLNQGGPFEWEIVYDKRRDFTHPLLKSEKISAHVKSIKRGDILEPVVIVGNNNVIDGRHKLQAYQKLGITEIAWARHCGKGKGVVKDEVYKPLLGDYISKKRPPMRCAVCGNLMDKEVNPKSLDYFVCPSCSYKTIACGLMGWTALNLQT